jgi:hypothetical protein
MSTKVTSGTTLTKGTNNGGQETARIQFAFPDGQMNGAITFSARLQDVKDLSYFQQFYALLICRNIIDMIVRDVVKPTTAEHEWKNHCLDMKKTIGGLEETIGGLKAVLSPVLLSVNFRGWIMLIKNGYRRLHFGKTYVA